ncbi:FAD synthase-like protein [Tanacetum coccineum]
MSCSIINSFPVAHSYTSIGSISDTVLNALLCVNDSTAVGKQKFRPTYMLSDGRSKRAGRARRLSSSDINGQKSGDPHQTRVLTASSVAVVEKILLDILIYGYEAIISWRVLKLPEQQLWINGGSYVGFTRHTWIKQSYTYARMHGNAGRMPYHVPETSRKRETPGNVRKRLGNVPGKSGNVSLIGVRRSLSRKRLGKRFWAKKSRFLCLVGRNKIKSSRSEFFPATVIVGGNMVKKKMQKKYTEY